MNENTAGSATGIDLANANADTIAALLCCLYEGPEIQRAATMLIEQAMDLEELRATPQHPDNVLALLNHIEDVVDDANWEKIDTALWNAVTRQYPTPQQDAEASEISKFRNLSDNDAAAPQHSVTEQAEVSAIAAKWANKISEGSVSTTRHLIEQAIGEYAALDQPLPSTAAPQIEYRYTGGVHWCELGPAEYMKENFDGVYRLKAGKFPTWQGDTAATQPEQDEMWNKAIEAEATANQLKQEKADLLAVLRAVVESPSRCVSIAEAALHTYE